MRKNVFKIINLSSESRNFYKKGVYVFSFQQLLFVSQKSNLSNQRLILFMMSEWKGVRYFQMREEDIVFRFFHKCTFLENLWWKGG